MAMINANPLPQVIEEEKKEGNDGYIQEDKNVPEEKKLIVP